jgi:hypothetical protein
MDNIDRRSVMVTKRVGDERDGMVFNKINPHILNPNVRPNSYDWTAEEFNRKSIDRIAVAEENIGIGILLLIIFYRTKKKGRIYKEIQ